MIYITRCLHETPRLISKKSHQHCKSMIRWKDQQTCPLCAKNFRNFMRKLTICYA